MIENDPNENSLILNQDKLSNIEYLFNQFIEDAKIDRVLHRYESHVKTIYDSLQLVLKNETDLFNKLLICKREYESLSMKYNQALKLSNIDNRAKSDLLEELEKAWQQASLAKNKEKRAMETVSSLKLEILNLSKLVEQDVGLTMGQEYNLREILKEKEKIIFENKKLVEEIEELNKEMNILRLKDEEYKKKIEESMVQVSQVNQELFGCKLEIQKLSRKNEHLEEEVLNYKKINENKELDMNKTNQIIQTLKQDIAKHEQNIKDLLLQIDKNKKENDLNSTRFQKLQSEIDQLYIKNDTLLIENSQLNQQLKRKEELIENLKSESIQNQKIRDAFERKIKQLDEHKNDLQNQFQNNQNEITSFKKEIENLNKDKDNFDKKLELTIKEKDQLSLELKKSKNQEQILVNKIKILKSDLKNSLKENTNLKTECEVLKKKILNFDKEKIKFSQNLNEFNSKLSQLSQDLKLKDLSIYEFKKKYQEIDSKFNDLKLLYDSTRADRNLYSKNLIKSKQELVNIKTNIENQQNLELTLKKSLLNKTANLNQLKKDNLEYKNNSQNLITKLDKTQQYLNENKSKLNQSEIDQLKLLKIINDLEIKFNSEKYIKQKLIIEKNILGSQLVRRNDEISLLYEKIRLLEIIIKRGEICFQKLTQDLNQARNQAMLYKKQNEFYKTDLRMIKQLKKELNMTERELITEKAKRNAIERMQNSINIHRWRKLKGCDPSTYELILKCNILQKKLIFKSEQYVSLQLKFIEKDCIFIELKKYFSRRILSEEESLAIQKSNKAMEKISKQLKSTLAENEMYSKLNKKHQTNIIHLQNEVKNYKQKYFNEKLKNFNIKK